MTPAPWKQWEGQVVDWCYPLRRYLGGTEQSAVFLTQIGDPEPQNAAIKLIPDGRDDADAATQWDRATQLSHPGLLRLLRIGRSQVNQISLRYAVTEYADENLAGVLAERPLSAGEVRELLKPLLSALAYLHGEGLVHGRVKPANILAVGDDLKLSVDSVTLVGEPGITQGPPSPYDSPEFRDCGCSPLGDVWSVGVTLVEALTRKLPAVNGPKEEPELPEGIPSEFLPTVRACLHTDPRRRATIGLILELLAHPEPIPLAEKPVERPAPALPTAPAPPTAPTSRRRLSYVLIGASAFALIAILAGPRLLRRPVANAQIEGGVVTPPPVAVTLPPAEPQPAKPTPFAAAPHAPPPVTTPPATTPSITTPAAPVAAAPKPAEHVESSAAEVEHQVLPDVPAYASRTIHGKVKIQVRAKVDAAGRVTDANVESQNSRYFAKLSLEAARQWHFTSGPADWILRFEFTPAGPTVRSSRVGR